jgi:hypothetical protein
MFLVHIDRYMPGLATEYGKDYSNLLLNVPVENRGKVLHAIDFVHRLCSKNANREDVDMEPEWETSYDMRPWTAYPDQKRG